MYIVIWSYSLLLYKKLLLYPYYFMRSKQTFYIEKFSSNNKNNYFSSNSKDLVQYIAQNISDKFHFNLNDRVFHALCKLIFHFKIQKWYTLLEKKNLLNSQRMSFVKVQNEKFKKLEFLIDHIYIKLVSHQIWLII